MKPGLVIRSGPFGRGVYAGRPYRKGAIVERAEIIRVPKREIKSPHVLSFYVFAWDHDSSAVALGIGSLYNHSHTPNLDAYAAPDSSRIAFVATRSIRAGEELTIAYAAPGETVFLEDARAKRARGEI